MDFMSWDFVLDRLSLKIGKILSVKLLPKANLPTFHITMDYGNNITKSSCAKFVRNYPNPSTDLIGRKFLTLINVPTKRIAGTRSEFLILGFSDEIDDGQAIGITSIDSDSHIEPGASVVKFNPSVISCDEDASDLFFSLSFKSGTIISIPNDSQLVIDLGSVDTIMAEIPTNLPHPLSDLIGVQAPILVNPNDKSKCILLVAEGSDGHRSILRVDKKVANGLKLF